MLVVVPGRPVFTTFNVTNSSVAVRWDPPTETNGDLIAYTLSIVVADRVDILNGRPPQYFIRQQLASVNSREVLEHIFNNLMPNTSYATIIRARNNGSYGEWSSPFVAATLPLMSPTSPVLLTSETPPPSNPCDLANCSTLAVCRPMGVDTYECVCSPEFVGDGVFCVGE